MPAKVVKSRFSLVAPLLAAAIALALSGMPASAFAAEASSESGQLAAGTTSEQQANADSTHASSVDPDAEAKAAAEKAEQEKLARKVLDDGLYNMGSVSKGRYSVAVKNGSTKAGAQVQAAVRDKADWSQKWAVAWDDESGYYTIRNMKSRKFLGVSGAVKAGAAVKQFNSASSNAQLWEPQLTSRGVMFKSADSTVALAITGKNANVKLQMKSASSTSSAQTFKLRKVDPIETDKTYFITSVSTNKRLQVGGNSRNANAKIGLAKPADTKAQKFRIKKAGASYQLQCVRSCYYLGAKGSSSIRQLAGKSGANKKWKIAFDPKSATFSLDSSSTKTRLNASAGKLTLKEPADGAAQQFTLSSTYAFKVFLNPGHGANSNGNGAWDSGAVGNGHTEAEFTQDLVRRVEKLLGDTDVKVVNGEKYRLAFWLRLPKAARLGCDAIVSVHFDAGADSGTLKMLGVQGKAAGSEELAQAVHKGVVSSLGLKDRGPSYRSDITCVNGSIPSMLTEICFMDNAHDVQTYLAKRDKVAAGLASGIVKASRNRHVIR